MHETWPLAKVPEVAHILSFHPTASKWSFIFDLRAEISEIWADFQSCHIWAWNLVIGQSSRSCIYTLFLPQWVEIELTQRYRSFTYTLVLSPGSKWSLTFALRAAVSKIRSDFKVAIFGHETWSLTKVSEVAHIIPKVPPESQISLRFTLRLAISKILIIFQFPQC